MANKVFYLDRDGATPQVVPANTDEKLKVYDSYEDIDTTDLVDGEIVSTKESAADGNNVYDYIDKQIEDSQSYSTEEQLTGGKWIDGKPIYRKCGIYNNGASIGTGIVILDSTLTRSYVDVIIATGGSAFRQDEHKLLPIGGYSGDNYRLCLAAMDKGLVKLESNDSYINFTWWIEYTKKTD